MTYEVVNVKRSVSMVGRKWWESESMDMLAFYLSASEADSLQHYMELNEYDESEKEMAECRYRVGVIMLMTYGIKDKAEVLEYIDSRR